MTGAVVGYAPATPQRTLGGPELATRVCDGILDALVVVLASWTVVYHASLLFGIGADAALVVEGAVLLLVLAGWRLRTGRPNGPAASGLSPDLATVPLLRGLATCALASAGVAAVAMATRAPWAFVWVPWLVAGVSGSIVASRALRSVGPRSTSCPPPPTTRWSTIFALASATGFAAFSMIALRPNPDDLFYVNVSQWVAEHGTFPVRDTLFGDLRYPMANWPPSASYDALTGALAHVLGTAAGNVVYVAVPPVATFLAVLALWRLLRAWRTPRLTVAMAAACLFLLWDGTSSYGSPGNLFATRLWQGKVILLCILVPVLLVHALRYVESPSRARAGWLFACGAAGVALSTTAIFLVPIVALAGTAPLLFRAPRAALAGFAAASAYPLGAGAVTVLLGGRSADDFGARRQYRFDPSWIGHEVFLSGVLALVAVAAVLLGFLVVPHPAARFTSGLAVIATGAVFVPGFTRLTYDLIGLGPTLWRVTWACTVAALVGVLASFVAQWLRRWWAAGAVGVAAVALLAAFGSPIWASDTSTTLVRPLHWQRGDETRHLVAWMEANTAPGDVVLAPDSLSITVTVTTTDIKTVAPRDYYLDYLRDDTTFRYEQRLTLHHLVNQVEGPSAVDMPLALHDLGVRDACAYRDDREAARLFRAAGYTTGIRTENYHCFRD